MELREIDVMKKLAISILTLTMILSVTACRQNAVVTEVSEEEPLTPEYDTQQPPDE